MALGKPWNWLQLDCPALANACSHSCCPCSKSIRIIDGWELLQAQDLRNELRIKEKLQQWQQLNSDLSELSVWLEKTEQELQKLKLPYSLKVLGEKIKKMKSEKPPLVPNDTCCPRGKAEDWEKQVDCGRPELGKILQIRQTQVADLDQGLDKSKTSLKSDSQSPKMQRMLDLQLSKYQARISEIEQQVDYLLENGEAIEDYQNQIDALSSKLEEVKLDLEDVQLMLEDSCLEEEGLDDENETSENERDLEESREIQTDPWDKNAIGDRPSSAQSLCHIMPPVQGHGRSDCETPVSVDSIPLEWDHTGDVGGSSSHEEEGEGKYCSALSEAHPWCSPDSPVFRKHQYNQAEMVGNVLSGPETSTPYKPDYVKRLSSASDTSISQERNMSANTSDEEPRDDRDLVNTGAVDKQPGIIDGWELLQAQDLRNELRIKEKLQQCQQLNSDLSEVSAWLEKTEQELQKLQKERPPSRLKALGQKVKKVKDMLKAFDNYKTVMLSINLSGKEFQNMDSTEFKELQNKLWKVNLHWEKETRALDNWRKGLQQALLRSKDFHNQIQNLILWLARADSRRNEAQIPDPNADLNTILECQRALMQLEEELLFQQPRAYSLEELTAYLLIKSDGEYIEADEIVHLIGRKLRQLTEQISHDLKAIQGNLDTRECHLVPGDLGSKVYNPVTTKSSPAVKKISMKSTVGRVSSSTRDESHQPLQAVSHPPSFFRRVVRAAFPFMMFILLLLLLACMVPFHVEPYSCTKANNFACSFHLKLQYPSRPPPT